MRPEDPTQTTTTRATSRRRRWPVALGVAAVALLVLLAAPLPAVRHQLELSFTRLPTPYTELWFTAAPQSTARGTATGFAVANREGRPVSYAYTVTASRAGVELERHSGQVDVAADQVAELTVLLSARDRGRQAVETVRVQLVDRPEAITYRLPGSDRSR